MARRMDGKEGMHRAFAWWTAKPKLASLRPTPGHRLPMPNSILTKARVLVVDDESSNVRLLERILEMFGCEHVRSTTDPREALKIYLEMQPDIILLDLHMPHMDGFQLMEQFRGVLGPESYVPILVLTADITVDTKRRALASGAKDLVTKPIDHSEVILRIKNLLENRFLHMELQRQNGILEEQVKERTSQLEETLTQLRSTQERVVRQERLSALGMMAGGIAHDFNNALTMVLGYTELLLPYLQENAPAERARVHAPRHLGRPGCHPRGQPAEGVLPPFRGERNPHRGESERRGHADHLDDFAEVEQPAHGRGRADPRQLRSRRGAGRLRQRAPSCAKCSPISSSMPSTPCPTAARSPSAPRRRATT